MTAIYQVPKYEAQLHGISNQEDAQAIAITLIYDAKKDLNDLSNIDFEFLKDGLVKVLLGRKRMIRG